MNRDGEHLVNIEDDEGEHAVNMLGEQAVNMLGDPGEQAVNNKVNMEDKYPVNIGEQLVNRGSEHGEHEQRQRLLKTLTTLEMCEELYTRIKAGEV